jgi:hypothetical protein
MGAALDKDFMEETTPVTETQPDAQATPKTKKGDVKAVKPAVAYVIKVSAASPVRSVRSAGIIFTDIVQRLPADHAAIAELKTNPWLEVTEAAE